MRHRCLLGLGMAATLPGCSLALQFEECSLDRHCEGGAVCIEQACLSGLDAAIHWSDPIVEDTTWTAERIHVLDRTVFVEPGVTLSIRPGTRVLGEPGSALVAGVGARVLAQGSQRDPIVFTSAQPEGRRVPGDWGGVVLLGDAPTNATTPPVVEGLLDRQRARFGGTHPQGSCGVLQYVRIEFAGFAIEQDNELNGLTLAGCGRGTLVDHLQVHLGNDDGIELFGGSVNLSHVVVTRAQDDSLDWDLGWTGVAQFVAIQQDDVGDNGIEGSSNADDPDAEPRTAPRIWNITMIGSGGAGDQRAITFKEGTAGSIDNAIIMGHPVEGIDVVDLATVEQLRLGALSVGHTMFFQIGDGGVAYFPDEAAGTEFDDDGSFDEAEFFSSLDPSTLVFGANPGLNNPFNLERPGWVPQGTSVLEAGGPPASDSFDAFDEGADYAGAFAPAVEPWTEGWTAYPAN